MLGKTASDGTRRRDVITAFEKKTTEPFKRGLGELIREVENLKTVAEFEMNIAKNMRMYYTNWDYKNIQK